MATNTELEAQIAALQSRIEELERRGRPSAPFKADPAPLRDLTENASMPPSAMREMAGAVGSVELREIVGDLRTPGALAPLASGVRPTVSQLNRSGSRSPSPLEPPPGVALADKLLDAQDRVERVELAQRLAKQELARRARGDDAA